MKKMIRNFGLIVLFGLGGLFAGNKIALDNVLVLVGSAAVFALMAEIIGCFNELDLESKKSLSKEELDKVRKTRLVVRDTAITFVIAYAYMTAPFGLLGFAESVPYLVAALMPAMITATISKAARIPSDTILVEKRKKQLKKAM